MKTPEESAEESTMKDYKYAPLTQGIDLERQKLDLLLKVAANLRSTNIIIASEIANAICAPITEYIDEVLKFREKQNENT